VLWRRAQQPRDGAHSHKRTDTSTGGAAPCARARCGCEIWEHREPDHWRLANSAGAARHGPFWCLRRSVGAGTPAGGRTSPGRDRIPYRTISEIRSAVDQRAGVGSGRRTRWWRPPIHRQGAVSFLGFGNRRSVQERCHRLARLPRLSTSPGRLGGHQQGRRQPAWGYLDVEEPQAVAWTAEALYEQIELPSSFGARPRPCWYVLGVRAIAWRNGRPSNEPAGYGFRVSKADRTDIPTRHGTGGRETTRQRGHVVPLSPSFWRSCSELLSAGIGRGLLESEVATWTSGGRFLPNPSLSPLIDMAAACPAANEVLLGILNREGQIFCRTWTLDRRWAD
jgi:hypothetical protein